MPKTNNQNDLLQEIKDENRRLAEFIATINSKIKKTDKKLALALLANDIKTIKLYKSILEEGEDK